MYYLLQMELIIFSSAPGIFWIVLCALQSIEKYHAEINWILQNYFIPLIFLFYEFHYFLTIFRLSFILLVEQERIPSPFYSTLFLKFTTGNVYKTCILVVARF